MSVRILGVAKFLLICALLTGCGGVSRNVLYRPLAPVSPDGQNPLGRERYAGWYLDLKDAEVHIAPVVLSSKNIWIFGPLIAFPTFWEEEVLREGPLRITVFVTAKSGASVAFDLGDFAVVLEDGCSLSPDGAAQWVLSSSEEEPVARVTLSGGQTWRGYLQYDVHLMDLSPFTLRLGTLSVNGQPVQLPPISFVRGKAYWSS